MVVRELMTSPVITIDENTTIAEAAGIMWENRIGALIIGDDPIKGIITESDIVRSVNERLDRETAVTEIMSDPVVTMRPGESVRVAGERMGHNTVKKLPVTERGKPVGIVTTTDIAQFLSRSRNIKREFGERAEYRD
jgi:CBS domain-containing protein